MESAIDTLMGTFASPFGWGWIEAAIPALGLLAAFSVLSFGRFLALAIGLLALWAVFGVAGWEIAGPFVWFSLGAMATWPLITSAPGIMKEREPVFAGLTVASLCAGLAVWDVPQGMTCGLALMTFLGMAVVANWIIPGWRQFAFLAMLALACALAGVDAICLLLMALGRFALIFTVLTLAWTAMTSITRLAMTLRKTKKA